MRSIAWRPEPASERSLACFDCSFQLPLLIRIYCVKFINQFYTRTCRAGIHPTLAVDWTFGHVFVEKEKPRTHCRGFLHVYLRRRSLRLQIVPDRLRVRYRFPIAGPLVTSRYTLNGHVARVASSVHGRDGVSVIDFTVRERNSHEY